MKAFCCLLGAALALGACQATDGRGGGAGGYREGGLGGRLVDNGARLDNHALRALPERKKRIAFGCKTTDGAIVPSGAKLIWPIRCPRK